MEIPRTDITKKINDLGFTLESEEGTIIWLACDLRFRMFGEMFRNGELKRSDFTVEYDFKKKGFETFLLQDYHNLPFGEYHYKDGKEELSMWLMTNNFQDHALMRPIEYFNQIVNSGLDTKPIYHILWKSNAPKEKYVQELRERLGPIKKNSLETIELIREYEKNDNVKIWD